MSDLHTDRLHTAQQYVRAGRLDEAHALLSTIVEAEPGHGGALEGLGYIAAKRNDYVSAAQYLDQAVAILPRATDRDCNAGHVNQCAGRYTQAIAHFTRALEHAPRHLPTLQSLVACLVETRDYEQALQWLERACAISPQDFRIQYERGRVLGELGRHEQEIAAYRRSLELRPDFVQGHVNLGVALRDLRRFDEALMCFKTAIALEPENAAARTNRAQTNLLLRNFEHGWRDYEWRWRDGHQSHAYATRRWTGKEPLKGRVLLIHAEQGLGDTLQFVRYIEPVAATGARIILRVQEPLLPLLKDYPGTLRVVGDNLPVPEHDYHCPLLSLPLALYRHAPGIPARVPYLFADPARQQQWQDVLPDSDRRLRIGIAWSGSRTHLNDRNRSASLRDWAGLFEADALFVSLQKDVRPTDQAELRSHRHLVDLGHRLETFADTAALVAQLDLVISVDTSMAHLAGAMGKSVWVLLPYLPDWRWQLDRADSPWYPTARLFRRTSSGSWPDLIRDVVYTLADNPQGMARS